MGIKGLHEILRPYYEEVHVSKYRGRRVGIDGNAWLHRGVFSCCMDIATGNLWWKGKGREAPYVEFFVKMLEMLRFFGVVPVVVFDGASMPMKADEAEARKRRRVSPLSLVSAYPTLHLGHA